MQLQSTAEQPLSHKGGMGGDNDEFVFLQESSKEVNTLRVSTTSTLDDNHTEEWRRIDETRGLLSSEEQDSGDTKSKPDAFSVDGILLSHQTSNRKRFTTVLGLLFTACFVSASVFYGCEIPAISGTSFCSVPNSTAESNSTYTDVVIQDPFMELLSIQNNGLKAALDVSYGMTTFPIQLHRQQMALSDLAVLLQESDPDRRNEMADMVIRLAAQSYKISKTLKKNAERAKDTIDSVIAVNTEASRQLAFAISEDAKYSNKVKAAVGLYEDRREQALVVVYKMVTGELALRFEELILADDSVLHELDYLERLYTRFYRLMVVETNSIDATKEELLGALWTSLGGNKRAIGKVNKKLELLNSMKDYRKEAVVRVNAAKETVQAEQFSLENLRQRVATPLLSGDDILIEAHMSKINAGIERMASEMSRAQEKEDAIYEALKDKKLSIE